MCLLPDWEKWNRDELLSAAKNRDPDALVGLAEYCRANGVALLTYGALAGGFLSDRWLGISGGTVSEAPEEYRCIVEEAGGWDTLQNLQLKFLEHLGVNSFD